MRNSRNTRAGLRGAAIVAAAAVMMAACTPSDPDAADDEGGTSGEDAGDASGGDLRIGTTADVVNFNPLVGNSRTDTWVTNLMYPSMMTLNSDGEKVPALATEWGYGEDGLTAWIEIRDDLEWTDGTALTAEDVAFTVTAVKDESLGTVSGMIGAMEDAEAVSDTRVEFTLSRPDGAFLNSIGFWMPIVPSHVFGEAPTVADFANDSDWVSAGPFVLTEVDRGQRYVLDAVDNYPLAEGGQANLDRVIYRVYPDVNTQVLALRSGELDLIANALPPSVVKELSGDDSLELYSVPSLGWAHMQYNMRREPLDQVEVRRALAHAVDYEAIRQVVLGGNAVSANSSVLTPTFAQWADDTAEEYAFDPDLSRSLLEDAGFEDANGDGMYDDVSFEMIYDTGDPIISTWAELVRDQSAEAGIEIELSGLERNTYLSRTQDRDFDIYAGSWAIIDEPQSNFVLLFDEEGFINYAGVDDPDIDALMEEASSALTVEDARGPLQEIARIVTDEVYDNVMYVEQFTFAATDQWTGFDPKPSELLSVVNPQSLASVRPAE
ncbi:ABC transporter substrate-binding protein [Phytoactinopolyspora alkaliphila]|uniref:ABC transporter substrate-binding protein n=1 Tax=Phytoactinopolyspora alkaliphila TaxID=1783498 RepID=A0A6N9YHS5_9ACTN|nr:ABC transporter substrate-binding protein [Phytoactinopolyspora alkaliphila]NED94553.1 ABC transporter substrate-binding protein [Phytoactinopolyspora alkaliphila]